MTNEQHSRFQRIIGRLEGLAEGLKTDMLHGTACCLDKLVEELRKEDRKPNEDLKLKAGGNYNVKVDDEKPSSYL